MTIYNDHPYWSDFVPNSTLYRILRCFHRTLATGVACRQGTLTPSDTWPRPFGTCICSSCWDLSFFRTCRYFSGLYSSNIPRYFLDFAFYPQSIAWEMDWNTSVAKLTVVPHSLQFLDHPLDCTVIWRTLITEIVIKKLLQFWSVITISVATAHFPEFTNHFKMEHWSWILINRVFPLIAMKGSIEHDNEKINDFSSILTEIKICIISQNSTFPALGRKTRFSLRLMPLVDLEDVVAGWSENFTKEKFILGI